MTWLPRRIVVVPIDFSDDSFGALAPASELAEDPTHLHAIHVLPVLEPTEPGIIWHTIDDETRSKHAEDALRKQLDQRGHEGIGTAIRFGDPGHQIAEYADHVGAGLIVVPSHGRNPLKRLLIGSVTDRIVRLAHCPVLVLKD